MKHEIEIPDLPEGWEAVAYRLGDPDELYYDAITKSICRLILASSVGVLIVRKKYSRRIVLDFDDFIIQIDSDKLWKNSGG